MSTGTINHGQNATCNSTPKISGWGRDRADDVDPVVVQRLIDGDPVPCTAWERRAAVVRLRKTGWSLPTIAFWLGIHERQVFRDLDRVGLVNTGFRKQRLEAAAVRREDVRRLHAAGARGKEIAELLNVREQTISYDLKMLGLRGNDGRRRPCRTRRELVAAFGHVLAGAA